MTSESDTEEFIESTGEVIKAMSLRLPEELLDRIDIRAKQVKLSRNAWMALALDWVLVNLPTGLGHPERDQVATAAPRSVTGTERVRISK